MNPITELRFLLKLQPIISQLQREFGMTVSVNMMIQVLGTLGQALNQIAPFVTSEKGKAFVAFGIGFVQLLAALMAHYSNPDGTSAKAAWTPPAAKPE